MYFDIYNNSFFAEDDGSSSSAHYSDYWFGYADSDNCNAGGTCYSPSGSIPIAYNDPFLTASSRAILDANGYGPGDELYLQRLWVDLSPTLRGDGFENENKKLTKSLFQIDNISLYHHRCATCIQCRNKCLLAPPAFSNQSFLRGFHKKN
jgi:hypothetical protein